MMTSRPELNPAAMALLHDLESQRSALLTVVERLDTAMDSWLPPVASDRWDGRAERAHAAAMRDLIEILQRSRGAVEQALRTTISTILAVRAGE